MLRHDFEYWKVERFVKDEADVQACKDIAKKYFHQIKEVFQELIAKSDEYPSVTEPDFVEFCTKNNILDEFLTFVNLQIAFVATNVELGEDQEGNDDRNLCRFELFEILIRMGRYKFLDSGKVTTYAEAFRLMCIQFILPHH